jgi:hypothetical protein
MGAPASVTQFGEHGPFELQVARGQIVGHRAITVFGFNPDVDTTEVTVWPLPSIIPQPAAALQMSVSSTNANDTAEGTGARTIVVQGLDGDHNEVTETVTLNGQNAVLTAASFLHINYMYVASAGSTKSAAGDIYIGTGTVTAGVPATAYNIIKFNYNDTITGCYTVPAGHTAYVMQGQFTAGQTSGSTAVQGRLVATNGSGIRRTAAVTTLNNGTADYAFEYPLPLPEKTTIEATAVGGANNNSASCLFVLVLIKNSLT